MKIKAADLPGIGKKLSFITAEQSMIVLIVHHTGKRELYFFEDADNDEADFSINLTGEETREFGAQLLGAMFQPVDMDKMKMFKNQIIIEWVDVSPASPLVQKTIAESQIRTKTGASIIGIVKGEDVIPVPDIHVVIHAGDTLMTVGKRDQMSALEALCRGEETT
ncbi:cation:proton antiporter regulatory subunit [Ammoniphilus sp. CFH 90114]|uniref:cation:proton antiporter regulatory subunit n=1 Tax=Ammoniphilus sp. CFH 90114 TaxID=2493665 RepID=UPI00100E31F3|nr:cation:proton antiporter regulatory subunit [Ammoniphilus sp. CFH 90114]RXT04901.1 potassium transporter TrkA [Ammoniphilus sp. CFH 90114]